MKYLSRSLADNLLVVYVKFSNILYKLFILTLPSFIWGTTNNEKDTLN